MSFASSNSLDAIIAGAGPAGSSTAIELALKGRRVLLIEEKKFPRAKLCGEFISPECLAHFKRLGVMEQMNAAEGTAVNETVFYSRNGSNVSVPSDWFKSGAAALGLSRAEMDYQLLLRARDAGVEVLEEAHVSRLLREAETVCGVQVKSGETTQDYFAPLTVDATGRTRALARKLDPPRLNHRKNINPLVAFKAHFENARQSPSACEIYFYKRGYGGLSEIEGSLSNLCFIVAAKDVRRYASDPEVILREVVMKNPRAAYTLADAHTVTPWLSVSLETFGRRTIVPAKGLLAVGDAAAFIDPFTGSGMLMALESGQLAADVINRHLASPNFESLANNYRNEYSRRFASRLRVAGLLRRAAFVPYFDEAAIRLFGASDQLRRKLARSTRAARAPKRRAVRF